MSVLMSEASADHARRVGQLRRAFQRQVRRRPTALERAAMRRAADLTAAAERAAADPNATLNDIVRIDNAAARARAAFVSLAGIKRPRPGSSSRTNWLEAGR
jgi:hypothetical protein